MKEINRYTINTICELSMSVKKKWILFLAVLLLESCFCFGITDKACAAADAEAPTATGVTLSTSVVTDSTRELVVETHVKDEGTGVQFVSLEVAALFGDSASVCNYSTALDEPRFDGSVSVRISVEDWTSAQYVIRSVEVTDFAGNRRSYTVNYASGSDALEKDGTGSYLPDRSGGKEKCYFKSTNIIRSDRSASVPTILSVTLPAERRYAAGESFPVYIDLAQSQYLTKIGVVYVWETNENQRFIGWGWEKKDDDTIKVTVPVSDSDPSGKYHLGYIWVYGKDNQEHWYNLKYDEETGKIYLSFNNINAAVKGDPGLSVKSNGDSELPSVKSISVRTNKVTKPGIAKIQAQLDDDIGIKRAYCSIARLGGNNACSKELLFDEKKSSRTVSFEIPMGTNTPKGEYYVSLIELEDFSGKTVQYNGEHGEGEVNGDTYKEVMKPNRDEKGYYLVNSASPIDNQEYVYFNSPNQIHAEDEMEVAFEMSISNPLLMKSVAAMDDGEAVRILITGQSHKASKALFEAIQGTDKILVFYKNNYQWIFRGKDITNPKDVDLDISINKISGEDYGFDKSVLSFDFPENGVLPGEVTVRIKADYTYNLFGLKHALYLYHLDQKAETLELEKQSDIRYYLDDTDHWCSFQLTHNSRFITTGGRIKYLKAKKGVLFKKKKTNAVFKITGKSTVSYVKPVNRKKTKINVPDTVLFRGKTYKVTGIEKNACRNMKSLKTVVIGKNVTTIRKKAFAGCRKLAAVTIKTKKLKAKKVGSKAFSGISKKAVIKVPKKKRKSYAKWLVRKGVSRKMKIKSR